MSRTVRRSYEGEIDVFMVYCPENDRVYVVPIEEAARGRMSLRVSPTLNMQAEHVRWAKGYELPA